MCVCVCASTVGVCVCVCFYCGCVCVCERKSRGGLTGCCSSKGSCHFAKNKCPTFIIWSRPEKRTIPPSLSLSLSLLSLLILHDIKPSGQARENIIIWTLSFPPPPSFLPCTPPAQVEELQLCPPISFGPSGKHSPLDKFAAQPSLFGRDLLIYFLQRFSRIYFGFFSLWISLKLYMGIPLTINHHSQFVLYVGTRL